MATLEDNLLTVREVKAHFRVSRATIHRLLQEGKLKGGKVGRAWRITLASVREYDEKIASGEILMGFRREESEIRKTKEAEQEAPAEDKGGGWDE